MRGFGRASAKNRSKRAITMTMVLTLCGGTAWATALNWTANTESDLAGYRVYKCNLLPCSRSAGTSTKLATLGPVTSLDIGSPAVVQYYFITAYDHSNNESGESGVATYTPVNDPLLPPPLPAAAPPVPSGVRFVTP